MSTARKPSPGRKRWASSPRMRSFPGMIPMSPDWDTLSADEKRLYAHMMEVFAGFMEHTDFHMGRLFDFLKSLGEFDNTLIMLISDNGASSEGGPTGSVNENLFFNQREGRSADQPGPHRRAGRPHHLQPLSLGLDLGGQHALPPLEARDLPRRDQRSLHRALPQRYSKARGEVRTQYAHAIDMVPTVLDLIGIEPPASIKGVTQSPIEGVSFAHTPRRCPGGEQASHPVL